MLLVALPLLTACNKLAVSVADTLSDAKTPHGDYISWREHLIDDEEMGRIPVRGAARLLVTDLDKDAHADILSLHLKSAHVRMAFGSEDPREWYLLSLVEGEQVAGLRDIASADWNGDGFPDVVVACGKGGLLYLQNPGGKVRGWVWKRILPAVAAGRGSFQQVFAADLNGDGRSEVIAAYEEPRCGKSIIAWFEPPSNPLDAAGWHEHLLTEAEKSVNICPVDLNGDGRTDIFVISQEANRLTWLENLGGEPVRFREHLIQIQQPEFRLGGSVAAFADLNGDGRLDAVVCGVSDQVIWLEQPSSPEKSWRAQTISRVAPDVPGGVSIADINGDGRPDIMVGTLSEGPESEDRKDLNPGASAGRLAWLENPGKTGGAWKKHDICRRLRAGFAEFVAIDLNRDGNIDFIGTRSRSGEYDGVFWLEQVRTRRPSKVFQPARKKESRELGY